ncbi:hypothetical protein H1P_2820006 [Hyella patelloides LEGE 07179]|uniref:Uncharacterized protein n=1 Tax=Hyella patelloides LEGE 07179 TaxID=945734 RepID=A0A563VTC9_9CYAN|nr:hypothetical protein [Hyella patelloides]VEP14726.1 hypothetical protein H1P_2820006 [Hyella patelloides LEGE 07179]
MIEIVLHQSHPSHTDGKVLVSQYFSMKFLLLKTLLLRKRQDEGFTISIIIAIALVIVLLSVVNLVQSSDKIRNPFSKKSTDNTLAAAKSGIARYRYLLINNRVLAVHNLDEWSDFGDQTCDAISKTGQNWVNNDSDIDATDTNAGVGSHNNYNNSANDKNDQINLTSDAAKATNH